MKRFHPALVALTIIGSSVVATTTRAEAQDTAYQGYVPGYNYGFAPEYSYSYATDYNYAYARPYYRYGYSRPHHYRHAHAYRYQYAGLYNYRYAHPYRYRYAGYRYAHPYRYQYAGLYNYRYAHMVMDPRPFITKSWSRLSKQFSQFSASISGASAGVRLPSGEAAA